VDEPGKLNYANLRLYFTSPYLEVDKEQLNSQSSVDVEVVNLKLQQLVLMAIALTTLCVRKASNEAVLSMRCCHCQCRDMNAHSPDATLTIKSERCVVIKRWRVTS
jgi:hypothetical protein